MRRFGVLLLVLVGCATQTEPEASDPLVGRWLRPDGGTWEFSADHEFRKREPNAPPGAVSDPFLWRHDDDLLVISSVDETHGGSQEIRVDDEALAAYVYVRETPGPRLDLDDTRWWKTTTEFANGVTITSTTELALLASHAAVQRSSVTYPDRVEDAPDHAYGWTQIGTSFRIDSGPGAGMDVHETYLGLWEGTVVREADLYRRLPD